MAKLVPSLDAPLLAPTATPNSRVNTIRWGGAPSFNRITREFDFDATGGIVMLDDVGAFIQWVWKALVTARYRFKIYNFRGNASFGNDLVLLLGQPYNDLVKQSVAERFCKEAIQFDSRIKIVNSVTTSLQADYMVVTISITMVTGRELQFQQSWTIR